MIIIITTIVPILTIVATMSSRTWVPNVTNLQNSVFERCNKIHEVELIKRISKDV